MNNDTPTGSYSDPQDDIVDDRALESAGGDQFGHAEFAAQGARTIRAMKTPSNIAIYAPWGSGKTSLANLLRRELAETESGFVYFDAFKYAEAPLRREFIRRVGKSIGADDPAFDRGLYEEEVKSGFRLDREALMPLVHVLAWTAAVALVGTTLVALVVAALSGGALRTTWALNIRRLLPAVFTPSIIIVPLLTLAREQLTITRRKYAPQSDEEFERLFRRLVETAFIKHADWKRLVVFIDELDRCAADEVASTLETMRTFLEVEDCVFVVAADRQVLERAAALRARQETPYDPRNPYYSAGSSYLDKIFQHQWQLPPMMASSLARFAQTLVEDRTQGVWAEVDASEVVSVLIPLHVQSPRRVKELLNAYAMAYRVAERRVSAGLMDTDLRSRAAELAKLVCLQLEFPVFASDLRNEPRLPELVLNLFGAPDAKPPSGIADEVWRRAQAYARGSVELDVIMAAPDQQDGVVAVGEETAVFPELAKVQGDLLIRYLQKTRRIAGPFADLVFLEGLGFAFGLPTSLAVRLKAAATEGRTADATKEIEQLPDDQALKAVQLLSLCVRESLPGVEGQNALATLLGVVGALRRLDLSPIVDQLVDAVNTALQDEELPKEILVGTLRLSLATKRTAGSELTGRVIGHTGVTEDPAIASFVLSKASAFPSEHVQRLGEILAQALVIFKEEQLQLDLDEWTDAQAVVVLSAKKPLADYLAALESEKAAPPPPAATGSAQAPQTAEDEEEEDAKSAVLSHVQHLVSLLTGRETLREAFIELILTLGIKEARDAVESFLPTLRPATTSSLNQAVLTAAGRRVANAQINWFDSLDPSIIAKLPEGHATLDAIMAGALAKLVEDPSRLQPYVESAARIARASTSSKVCAKLTEALVGGVQTPLSDPSSVTTFPTRLRIALEFEMAELVSASEWRAPYLKALTAMAQNPLADAAIKPNALSLLQEAAPSLVDVEHFGEGGLSELDEAVQSGPWLEDSQRMLIRLMVGEVRVKHEPDHESPVDASALAAAFASSSSEEVLQELTEAAAVWLRAFRPSPNEAWTVIGRFASRSLTAAEREGLNNYAQGLSTQQRTALIEFALASFPEEIPSDEFLEALGAHDSNLTASGQLITAAFAKATNEEHRRAILRLWGALRLTDRTVTERLMSSVMVPMIGAGKTSRDLVLQNLHLVSGLPNREKRRLAQEFENNTKDEERQAAQKRLAQAGLMVEKGVLLTRRIEHLKG